MSALREAVKHDAETELVEVEAAEAGHSNYNGASAPAKPALKGSVGERGSALRRNISWRDFHGEEIHTVVEYEPSR